MDASGRKPQDELAEIEREYGVGGDAPGGTGWTAAIAPMARLLAAARDVAGADTLTDALGVDLGGMASTLGLRSVFDDITLLALIGDRHAADEVLSRLARVADALSNSERRRAC